jgi:hypothetical protein
MSIFGVGRLYVEGRTQWPEEARYQYRRGAHELALMIRGVSECHVRALGQGEAEFALVVGEPILVLCYRFGDDVGWGRTIPFNWHLMPLEERVDPPLAGIDAEPCFGLETTLWVSVVEANDGVVRARRAFALSREFVRSLHSALRQQASRPFAEAMCAFAPPWLHDAPDSLLERSSARMRCAGASYLTLETRPAQPSLPCGSRLTRDSIRALRRKPTFPCCGALMPR